jgi:hypothetical protein
MYVVFLESLSERGGRQLQRHTHNAPLSSMLADTRSRSSTTLATRLVPPMDAQCRTNVESGIALLAADGTRTGVKCGSSRK